jgi:hypothetical protein
MLIMNDMVKMSIDGRKNAFYSAYEINDDSIKKEIDELFNKIYDFGKDCTDATQFETAFATSPLNNEYINLFTKVAQTCKPIVYESTPVNVKSDEEMLKEELESEARYQMKEATLPARRVAREAVDRAARNTPILGDVIQAKQTMDLFGKFRKKKDD